MKFSKKKIVFECLESDRCVCNMYIFFIVINFIIFNIVNFLNYMVF